MSIIKYLKSFGLILLSILFLSILIGTLSYFNIVGTKSIKIFEIIATIISVLIGSIYLGKNSNQKGFLEGIKIGLFMIVFLFIFNFLAFDQGFNISNFFFYIIILMSAILGSILGINKKSSMKWTLFNLML